MVSEVFNMDCVEYMRTLPDNHFDIAICDPPYGDADSGNFHLGGGGLENGSTATSSHKLPPPNHSKNRLESTHKEELGRQSTDTRQSRLRRQIQPIFGGGYKLTANFNVLTGMLPHHRSSSMNFSA